MVQIDDIMAFVAVVETGSFTVAAVRLETTKSVVSRRVGDLEKGLGATLLERGTRGVRPNEVGAVYYAKCVRILESIHAANDFVAGFNNLVAGPLRVVVSRIFHEPLIAPLLNRFAAEHPDVLLQVEAPRPGSLADMDFDVALQAGTPADSDLIARPLFDFNYVMCASPDYLQRRGAPLTPNEMSGHDALVDCSGEGDDTWCYRVQDAWDRYRLRERMRSDDYRQLLAATRAGLGIAMVPESLIEDDLASGRLCRLLPDIEAPAGQLSLLYPRSRRASRKVQKLFAFLHEACQPGRDPV